MKQAPYPKDEEERLKTLHNLDILDTLAEERFDRITRIAKQLFDVPIALVSLVDNDRQWFKSKQGLSVNETPREVAFCSHTILFDKIMMVEDTMKDDRFHDNPLVTRDPKIRSYMGCPLKIEGYNIGTFCLIDTKERTFTDSEKLTARDLADLVQSEINSLHISTTDELTSLTNRRGFKLIASHVFSYCLREKKPLTLLYFDLNKFKKINDDFCHAEGDTVLKAFAQALCQGFRNMDIIARLGGDEFCILCPGLHQEEMPKLLSRLDDALATSDLTNHTIDYSVGFIELDASRHSSIESLIAEADQSMYERKNKSL